MKLISKILSIVFLVGIVTETQGMRTTGRTQKERDEYTRNRVKTLKEQAEKRANKKQRLEQPAHPSIQGPEADNEVIELTTRLEPTSNYRILPNELLREISQHLEVTDLAVYVQTNRRHHVYSNQDILKLIACFYNDRNCSVIDYYARPKKGVLETLNRVIIMAAELNNLTRNELPIGYPAEVRKIFRSETDIPLKLFSLLIHYGADVNASTQNQEPSSLLAIALKNPNAPEFAQVIKYLHKQGALIVINKKPNVQLTELNIQEDTIELGFTYDDGFAIVTFPKPHDPEIVQILSNLLPREIVIQDN